MAISSEQIKALAAECGFELAGITAAVPHEDFARFDNWRRDGHAGEMGYLTDRRGDLREDPRHLLPSAQSIVCVGKLYNTGSPRSIDLRDDRRGWISRYAWGSDYHQVMRDGLGCLAERIEHVHGAKIEARICVDTAPLLERSYARAAGLGWIGRNTCLINQAQGSWFFLGELLLAIPLTPDTPAPDRCGTCRRCIDACPTDAIVLDSDGRDWQVNARLCISYLTIEKRGPVPEDLQAQLGNHVFGCDICQDVCPWNGRAPNTGDPSFTAQEFAPGLESLAGLTEDEFRILFRQSPVWRAKYSGFLRNVASAMGNSDSPAFREPLRKLSLHPDRTIADAAAAALRRIRQLDCEEFETIPGELH